MAYRVIAICAAFWFFCVCFLFQTPVSWAAPLSVEEQQRHAETIYKQLVAVDSQDFDTIIRLLRQVIDQCPDTERAQESVWRLSNLYLLAYDKPDHAKVIELMRYLIDRYPQSPIVPHAKQRLLRSYEDVGNMEGARLLYEEALLLNPDLEKLPEHAAFLIGYAKTLASTGKPEKARIMYQRVVDYGDAIEDWLRGIAVDALQSLK